MSELEKAKREMHEKWRKKWMTIQTIIICVFIVATLISFFVFDQAKKNTIVPYTENGNAIHHAYLADNSFYEEEYLNGTHAYVASLIKSMTADFSYDLEMAVDNVLFQYTYRIDAQIEIRDKDSNSPIFNPVKNLVPATKMEAGGKRLSIHKLVTLDYHEYNRVASEFVTSYNLKNTVNTLIVRMYVEVVGMSESFARDNTGEYVVEMHVPLLKDTVKPVVNTTVPAGVQSIVAKDTGVQNTAMWLTIGFGGLAVLASGVLGLFVLLTRNKHIDYARKVQMLVNNYKSYIQKILDEYDTTDHQVLRVEEFTELLEIRDTIRQPIFMYENTDKTSTKFFVVTCQRTIYCYEIKVEEDEEDYWGEEIAEQ